MTMPHSKQMPVMCCTACVDMSQGRHGTDVIGQTPGTVPTLLLLVSQMRKFAVIEREREQNFGKLIQQWLAGMLPDIQLRHQTQGKKVVDIQLFVKVGDSAPCWTAPVRCHVLVLQFQLGHLKAGTATLSVCPCCRLQR